MSIPKNLPPPKLPKDFSTKISWFACAWSPDKIVAEYCRLSLELIKIRNKSINLRRGLK